MRRVLGRVADICRVDDEALCAAAEAARGELCEPADSGEIVLDLKKWVRYNLSLKRRVIRSVIGSLDPVGGEVELSWVDGVVSLAEGDKPGGRVDLGRGLAAYREYDKVIIGPAEETRSPEPFQFIPPCRDRFDWGGDRLRIDFEVVTRPGEGFPPQEGSEAWFNPGAVAGPITVRPWEPGDTIRPFASSGVRKLSDLFTDYKVPRRRRRQVPVVADEAGIIWVVGYRLADRVRVVEGEEKVLRGRVVREDVSGGT
jgi:tRNA(Ile)-lysidine synthase